MQGQHKAGMGKHSWRRIVVRSSLTTAVSILATLVLVAFLLPRMGGELGPAVWRTAVLCVILVAYPVSGFVFRQAEQMRDAHVALVEAHRALAAAHEKLALKASHDDMTGMLNRESFFEALEAARRRIRHGALLIVDADHFKNINDTHGHLTGDDALTDIAGAISGAVRAGDILGRIGGEEFAVFMPGSGSGEAGEVAERIRAAVAALCFRTSTGAAIPLTVSTGASVSRRGASLSDLLREADARLYAAKRSGRNRVVATGGMRAAA